MVSCGFKRAVEASNLDHFRFTSSKHRFQASFFASATARSSLMPWLVIPSLSCCPLPKCTCARRRADSLDHPTIKKCVGQRGPPKKTFSLFIEKRGYTGCYVKIWDPNLILDKKNVFNCCDQWFSWPNMTIVQDVLRSPTRSVEDLASLEKLSGVKLPYAMAQALEVLQKWPKKLIFLRACLPNTASIQA